MSDRSNHLQDATLSARKADGKPVSILLLTGARLVGRVIGHDAFTILVERDGIWQQVEKSAIVAIDVTGADEKA